MKKVAVKHIVEELLIPAGEHVQDWVVENKMSVSEFCTRMGMSRMSYNRIVNGKQAITAETASKLSRVTGIDAYYWLGLDGEYQMDKVRLAEQKRAESERTVCLNWVNSQPIAELVKKGLLPQDMRRKSPFDQETLLLCCYRVSSRRAYEKLLRLPAISGSSDVARRGTSSLVRK